MGPSKLNARSKFNPMLRKAEISSGLMGYNALWPDGSQCLNADIDIHA